MNLEDPSAYQDGEVKSVKDEVFSTPIKPIKDEKSSKKTSSINKKISSPSRKKKSEEE